MDKRELKIMHPLGVFIEAFRAWGSNLIPVFYSISVFLLSILFGLGAVAIVILNLFFGPMIIQGIGLKQKGGPCFMSIFVDAVSKTLFFLKTLLVLLIFMAVLLSFAYAFFIAGTAFYFFIEVAHDLKIAVLLATSTAVVICLIASAWYGFFFSLAPLIAGFEKRGPLVSIRQSKARIKGNAMRYLSTILLSLVFYFIVGLGALFVVTRFTYRRDILGLVDPAVVSLLAPLGLAVWFHSYQKLSELKDIK